MDEKSKAIEGSETVDTGRREALAKLGAYAAFTVPAVTGLLVSQKASALSISIGANTGGNKLPDANGVSKADETRSA